MHRVPTGSSRQIDEDWIIDFPSEFQLRSGSYFSSPRRKVDANSTPSESCLHRRLQIIFGQKDVRKRSWIKENWIHAIPLLVLLSLFILWWFSYPVDCSIKGGVAEALLMVIQTEPNETNVHKVELLSTLASTALTPISLGMLSSDYTTKVSTLSRSML